MTSFDDIFDAIKPAKLGRIIGVTTEHAGAMKRRGSIPAPYWPALVEASGRNDVPALTIETLANMAASRPRGSSRHPEAAS